MTDTPLPTLFQQYMTEHPATYKGEDLRGRQFQDWTVLGWDRQHCSPNGTRANKWWVKCKCGGVYSRAYHNIVGKERSTACADCRYKGSRGQGSCHYKGGKHVPGYFISHVKQRLTRGKRTLDFNLSFDHLDAVWEQQNGKCVFTGRSLNFGGPGNDKQTASLNRIDSNQGYIEGNIQFVHKTINVMKWALSNKDFIELCKEVVNHQS